MIEHLALRPAAGRRAVSVTLCLLLGACAGGGGWFGSRDASAPAQAVPANAVVGNDPIVAFAARAQPGSGERVTLANGQAATVRVTRAYHSANGRECREVLVGSGMAERQRLVCVTEAGWAEVRPLLRGGGAARP
jgi:hypothetical protein